MKSEYQLTIERIERNERAFLVGDKLASALITITVIGLMVKIFGW